jgi:hypothetical protein
MASLDHVSRWRERELATRAELEQRAAWEREKAAAEEAIAALEAEGNAGLGPKWRRDFGLFWVGAWTTRK